MKLNKLDFEQYSTNTDEFKSFAKLFRKELKKDLKKQSFTLVKLTTGHFYLSGFFKDSKENLYYFSWHNGDENLLYRTVEHLKDFTGGSNNYTSLDNFKINNLY